MTKFSTYLISEQGGRASNEDACNFLLLGGLGCWVLADGLGGHRGGGAAAHITIESVLEAFAERPEASRETLLRCLQRACRALGQKERQEPSLKGMSATAVVLLCSPVQALWAHLGDSRLYRFRPLEPHLRTLDHSVAQALVASSQISPADIRTHPDRSKLRRSLSAAGALRPDLCEPCDLHAGDAFLLCSDGFWEGLSGLEMQAELCKSDSPRDWLSRLQARLRCKGAADADNYSAAAIFVQD